MSAEIAPTYLCPCCHLMASYASNAQCPRCRVKLRTPTESPDDIATREACERYDHQKVADAVYTCWTSKSPDPELLEISRFVYYRSIELAGVESHAEQLQRAKEMGRAPADWKRIPKRNRRRVFEECVP